MMTKPVIDPVDALAKYLKVPVEEIQVWNDDSMTLINNDKVEYYTVEDLDKWELQYTESFCEKVGQVDGYTIFKN